jgi:hypothetical protein
VTELRGTFQPVYFLDFDYSKATEKGRVDLSLVHAKKSGFASSSSDFRSWRVKPGEFDGVLADLRRLIVRSRAPRRGT